MRLAADDMADLGKSEPSAGLWLLCRNGRNALTSKVAPKNGIVNSARIKTTSSTREVMGKHPSKADVSDSWFHYKDTLFIKFVLKELRRL
jgi:hypothetical protein